MSLERQSPPRWLRSHDVCDFCGFSPTTFWRIMKSDPDFPKPRYLTPTLKAWPEDEVSTWREARAAKLAAKYQPRVMPVPQKVQRARARAAASAA